MDDACTDKSSPAQATTEKVMGRRQGTGQWARGSGRKVELCSSPRDSGCLVMPRLAHDSYARSQQAPPSSASLQQESNWVSVGCTTQQVSTKKITQRESPQRRSGRYGFESSFKWLVILLRGQVLWIWLKRISNLFLIIFFFSNVIKTSDTSNLIRDQFCEKKKMTLKGCGVHSSVETVRLSFSRSWVWTLAPSQNIEFNMISVLI